MHGSVRRTMSEDLKTILADGGLMIVESPTKAREITKFLPAGGRWKVVATLGYMFKLKDPKNLTSTQKKQGGDYSVRLDDLSFKRFLERDGQNSKQFTELQKLVRSGRWKHFYVSTDPDEAGELIGREVVQHLQTDLEKSGMDVRRASWHEITRKAVEAGLQSWGQIDDNKADSAEARQVYDRLFGFSVSHYLWSVRGGRSGGRAQSPCLRLVVDREKERMAFRKAAYGSIEATFNKGTEKELTATLVEWKGKRIATGGDFDSNGKLARTGKIVLDDKTLDDVIRELRKKSYTIKSVKETPYTRNPPAPYTTSSYQQNVGSKLGLSSKQAMTIAQQLFENSIQTYSRTDSPAMADEAVSVCRQIIASKFHGEMPATPKKFKSKSRNAQEGHECLRPIVDEKTGSFPDRRAVARLAASDPRIDDRAGDVYDLVWRRTVASQMDAARGVTKTIRIESTDGEAVFSTASTRIDYKGFMEVYDEL